MSKIKILHSADFQIKNREKAYGEYYAKTLFEIENVIVNQQIDIYIFAGDLFEYPEPNDSEREIVYQHLSRLVSIKTLKEIIIMNGNHDLIKDRKKLTSNANNNPLDTYFKSVNNLTFEERNKFIYCKYTDFYESKFCNLTYLIYSLEDEYTGVWQTINEQFDIVNSNPNRYIISLYHDMIKEYIDSVNLPIQKSRYDKLFSIEDFKTNWILAGDIHESLVFESKETNRKFIYPGSSIQRNFGEGSYFTYPTGEIFADYKYVNLYEFDNDTLTFEFINKIKLSNPIAYNTININISDKIDWKNYLSDIVSTKISYGTMLTNIRLILSNLYINDEQSIIDFIGKKILDINYVSDFNIEINYDKVIQSVVSTVDQKIQTELNIDFNQIDIADSQISDSDLAMLTQEDLKNKFSDIILDSDKLEKLFKIILESQKSDLIKILDSNPDINPTEIFDNIYNLFREQLNISIQHNQNYDIKFDYVETNLFMRLGPNRINLDNEGITRILGTNGIGKTTLYYLLYWNIRGILFENLKQNQKQKNLSLIFNDILFNQDKIVTKLTMIVNDSYVSIYRWAERIWKNNITDDDKKIKNWKDNVSKYNSTVKVEIIQNHTKFESLSDVSLDEKIIKTGDEAEMFISRIFGNIPETIMILNHLKIDTILKMKSEDLREIVLNYIGVDYLTKLENQLPTVKSSLIVEKPKKTKIFIKDELSKLNNELQLIDNNLITNTSELQIQQLSFSELEENLSEITNKLIEIGNVNLQIEELNNQNSQYKSTLVELRQLNLVKKDLPTFNESEPQINQSEIDNLKTKIEQLNTNILENEKTVKIKNLEITEIKNSTIDKFKEKITLLNDTVETLENELINLIGQIFSESSENYKFLFDKLQSEILEKQKDAEINKENYSDKLIIENNQLHQFQILAKQLKSEIDTGICESCKRPLENITQEFLETKKIKLNQFNLKIENSEKLISEIKSNINDYLKIINQCNIELNHLIDLPELKNLHFIKMSLSNLKNNINNKLYIDELQKYLTVEKHTLISEQFNKVTTIKNQISKLNSIINDILSNNFSDILKSQNFYLKIVEIENTVLTLENIITQDKINIESYKVLIDKITETFLSDLTKYKISLQGHNELLKQIVEDNNSIQVNLNKITLTEQSIFTNNEKLNNLKNKNLPLFNSLTLEKNKLSLILNDNQNIITTLNEQITNSKLNKQRFELQKQQLNEDYKKYLEYESNALIYKYYDKLITKDFKDIVFSYYRNYLNNTLNYILSGLNFKLSWDSDGDLYMIELTNNREIYRPVQLVSGMQTCFLGLSLIYTFHLLNVTHQVSTIFIDEISGVLNDGKHLSNKTNVINYQEMLKILLSKFSNKSIFIVDHVIDDMNESTTYEVVASENGTSKYIKL